MIEPGQASLDKLGLPEDDLRVLRGLWIETADEAVALVSALSNCNGLVEKSGLGGLNASQGFQFIAPDRLARIRQAQRGGVLGCLVEPQVLESVRQFGSLKTERTSPLGAFGEAVPQAVRLMNQMQPVRNQGERGTCVAFASTALREFLAGSTVDLSEQFLYWACKELDGEPGSGTHVHTAMSALAQYGICEESVWPYNPMQTDTEGQGPASSAAIENARNFQLVAARTVEPGLVIHYKHILAGQNGKNGMPVAFGTLVFNSWYMSAETHRTGKITLPLPGEDPTGGHAWCVVGYVDDENVPGGGYFIVRNSWGCEWAGESPEAVGHAMMPYEYAERFAMEAFTGPLSAAAVTPELRLISEAPEWQPYVHTLDKDLRDPDGKLLDRGTKVLAHPSQPDVAREDTPANRQKFLKLDRTWTKEARSQEWFPPPPAWAAAFQSEFARAQAAKQRFFAGLEENLKTSVKHLFPATHLPFRILLLPWEPRIRKVCLSSDLTSDLIVSLLQSAGVPSGLDSPAEWKDQLATVNGLRVYSLHTGTIFVQVVVGFVSPVFLKPNCPISFSPPSSQIVELVRKVASGTQAEDTEQRPVYVFYAMGSPSTWGDFEKGLSGGDFSIVLSHPRSDSDGWLTVTPPLFTACLSFRDFVDRLRPLTHKEMVSKVKALVDSFLETGYTGNITVEKIQKLTDFRRTQIQKAFLDMQEHAADAYKMYWVGGKKGGALAIGIPADHSDPALCDADFETPWWFDHLWTISGFVIVAGLSLLGTQIQKKLNLTLHSIAFVVSVLFMYATAMVQKKWNQLKPGEE
jgi:hypothetical protein